MLDYKKTHSKEKNELLLMWRSLIFSSIIVGIISIFLLYSSSLDSMSSRLVLIVTTIVISIWALANFFRVKKIEDV